MDQGSVLDDIAEVRAAYDRLAGREVDTLTHPDLLKALDELEVLTRQMPTQSHRLLARLQREASPVALGARSWKMVLSTRLRISASEAARRLAEATALGPRTALTGEPLEPLLAHTAAARAQGAINAEHVAVLRDFLANLPTWVDTATREAAEADLVDIATGFGPEELRKAARLTATLIDQDGPEPDDTERARTRSLTLGPQQPDGMTKVTGWLDPQARATLEPVLAKLAAPGMCNPDDETPCTSGIPSQAQIDADGRSLGQRQHDALTALGRTKLSSGELGRHHGLPVTIIVSTTLQDLQRGAGSGITAGGTVMPMAEVIRLASHAYHYLVVYDGHTQEPLYLGRAKRLASVGQRIVLHSRDRGCTFPGCHVPGYGTQVHHVNGWAKHDGQTNIDELALACGADNRLAETGWTVRISNGIAEWIPPPELDVGQPRTNFFHHPERLLRSREVGNDP